MHIILTGRLSASFPCLASLRQHTKLAANLSNNGQNFNGSGSFIFIILFSHIHGRLFKPPRCVCYTLLAINFSISPSFFLPYVQSFLHFVSD